jgi:hypothetical protein
MWERCGRQFGREVLAVQWVCDFEGYDGEKDADGDPADGRVLMERPPGLSRTEVQPRADGSEADDESHDVQRVLGGWRGGSQMPDVCERPPATQKEEGDKASPRIGIFDVACTRQTAETEGRSDAERQHVPPKWRERK